MAAERRPQKFFNREFAKIVQEGYEASEKVELSAEMGGFKGEIAERIVQLQAEGIGRTIGFPASLSDRRAQGAYQEIMYALPLTDETVKGVNKRVLLVLPHDNGYDLAIVSPQNKDKTILKRFDEVFSPSEDPYVLKSNTWQSEPNERTLTTFVSKKVQFAANYESVPSNVSFEEILAEAIDVARARKKPKEAEVVFLQEIFNSEGPGDQKAA